jgi:hypothetical protein
MQRLVHLLVGLRADEREKGPDRENGPDCQEIYGFGAETEARVRKVSRHSDTF